jgi:hypothetical protein
LTFCCSLFNKHECLGCCSQKKTWVIQAVTPWKKHAGCQGCCSLNKCVLTACCSFFNNHECQGCSSLKKAWLFQMLPLLKRNHLTDGCFLFKKHECLLSRLLLSEKNKGCQLLRKAQPVLNVYPSRSGLPWERRKF